MTTTMKTTKLRRRAVCVVARRRAVTLVEIMASVLVLAVGLVGVLAAIPFGGMRMAQMNEADRSADLGVNAAEIFKAYGWANPESWFNRNWNNGSQLVVNVNSLLADNPATGESQYNLTYPFVVDPLGCDAAPEVVTMSPNGGFSSVFTRVNPLFPDENRPDDAKLERAFYLGDDIVAGYDDSEDEADYRPRLELEEDGVLSTNFVSLNTTAYGGRYTWMACVYPKSDTGAFYNCAASDISSVAYDAVVFQDREIEGELAFTATLETSGYQGGTIELDLTTARDVDNAVENDSITRNRFMERLIDTRYVMLSGREDYSEDGYYPAFARWYKIASYSVVDRDASGAPTRLRMSVIGADMPKNWQSSGSTAGNPFTVLFFPGAVNVHSGWVLL